MRVLVTGGAGFIGSHLADAYLRRGDEVTVVDSLVGGRRTFVPAGARFHHLDIRDPALREVFARERPQVVNHHAAQASVSLSVRDPLRDAEVNLLGTLRIVALCVEFGVEHLIFASTGGALYGDPERLPADEATPVRPLSPYGCAKFCAEQYIETYGRLHGLSAACLRYANVYGPRQDPHGEAGVVAIFTRALLDGRAPTIHGDGEQTRDFIYVDDVVRANLLATDRRARGAFNVGTAVPTSVNQLYRALARYVQPAPAPVYGPPRPGDVRHVVLAAEAARARLGWTPEVSLEDGLAATVAWFRTHAA
ncbi:MAG: NAD-dependent epimerase/dehydratase family protein [Armatimonadota bacterium]|nr:NAD-dependent epimerase/dehydratase family protein [Armatimonadota bacterium]MDR7533618.1 NAD-dependent epimerase/dehydratase family protein [Armatimonadota bacterium]MDR7537336.1 NAD-dependent epimerase/dehydratase family protein [Armatimonadota bacterium]